MMNYTLYEFILIIIIFQFSKNIDKCKVWINFVEKDNFKPKRSHVLCSKHFSEDCFDKTSKTITRLKPDAVPTIQITRLKHVSYTINHTWKS